MSRALVLIVMLPSLLLLAACGKDAPLADVEPATTAPVSTTTATSTTAAVPARHARDGCSAAAPAKPSDRTRRRSRRTLSTKRPYTAVLSTNCGTIRILLAVRSAPKTTSSFAGLVRNGFYDGLTFHRIAKPGGNDYVIQGGDPGGDGNGGPGFSVVEPPRKGTRYERGIVAMAKTAADAPGTSGSQFFIVTADEGAPLPPEYALLGRVTGSDAVVSRIARLETDPVTEMPIDPVVIESARIVRR